MAIENLFNNSDKSLPFTDIQTIGSEIESADYVRTSLSEKDRFIPDVDYSNPANFAFYGSAESYYADSINYILTQYPYDGSLNEKLAWQFSASCLDRYIFDKQYPRTAGYVTLGLSYTGSAVSSSNDYSLFSSSSYITFRGGPNTASSGMAGTPLYKTFNFSNVYDPVATRRSSNLEINGTAGLTLEFWLNKNGYSASFESPKQVIFDIWNSASLGASNYGRFRVEIHPGTAGETNRIWVELVSGTTGLSYASSGSIIPIGLGLSLTDGNWHQYSLSIQNTGSQMIARLYTSGTLNDTAVTGTSISPVTGTVTMLGALGSLITTITGSSGTLGWGVLSGSVDELRYWKTRRNEKQIGRYWFTQVGAGSNTDASNTTLGLYYKFNEGLLNSSSLEPFDARILDYSGRISNGTWNGYVLGGRNTSSAMERAGVTPSEFKDPIIYSFHTGVVNLQNALQQTGSAWDYYNNAGIYNSFPEWITKDDSERSGELKKLAQTMASFFDNVHLQIKALPSLKAATYTSSSFKPYPFVSRYLESLGLITPELFTQAEALESLASRDDYREYQTKLYDIKNLIYKNLYNNLPYIFKSKGTEKSFRNVLRCFGTDDELIKINLYGDNVTYELKDNVRYTAATKKYVDFNHVDKFYATVYQITSSATSSTRSYIAAPANMLYHGNTYQIETIFPKKIDKSSPLFFDTTFTTSSIFGCHTANCFDGADKTWVTPDYGNFQVIACRPALESRDVYFALTGTAGYQLLVLTSSVFKNTYDNSKWNLNVRIKPQNFPYAGGVTGSVTGSDNSNFIIEFVGYNAVMDVIANSFYLTGTLNYTSGSNFMTNPKRFFMGAHRTNFTGSVLYYTDLKIGSMRVWMDYVEDAALIAHAKDPLNYGRVHPYRNAYMTELSRSFGI